MLIEYEDSIEICQNAYDILRDTCACYEELVLSDIEQLLRGRRYLLDEYVRLGPNQAALEYAMAQDQDQGMQDIIAVLREAASESAEGISEEN